MSTNSNHPHLGELIAARLRQLGMSKAEFGRRINTSRQNVSLILDKSSLDTELTMRIGKVLQVDYFQLLSGFQEGPFGKGRIVELQLNFANQKLLLVTAEPDDSDPPLILYPTELE